MSPLVQTLETEKKPGVRPLRAPTLVKTVVVATVVMFLAEVLRIFVGSNFHCVVPGQCYRSAQPTAQFLKTMKLKYGVCTIINLRDENEDDDWYQEEKRAAEELGLNLVNAGLRGIEQTPAEDFRKVAKAIAESPEPILIHCASGCDRSGLASAMYLLTRTNTPLAEARQQLHIRYGHFLWINKACLIRTLDSYEGWLEVNGWQHRPEHFLTWVDTVYVAQKFQ